MIILVNFVVIEDNAIHRKNNIKLITNYMMSNKLQFDIFEYEDYSKDLLNDISSFNDNSVYIIDLELPSGDGLDIARYIRNELNNWTSPIIIITAHVSLYYDVYKQRLQILDFIGKCEDIKSNLATCIDICIKMLSKPDVYRYTYKNIDYALTGELFKDIYSVSICHEKLKRVFCYEDLEEDSWYVDKDGLYVYTKQDLKGLDIKVLMQGRLFSNGDAYSDRGLHFQEIIDQRNLSSLSKNEVERISFDLFILYSHVREREAIPEIKKIRYPTRKPIRKVR